MVPKLDQRRGYASKPRIPPYRSVAISQGDKPIAGPFMSQEEGQEFRQITMGGEISGQEYQQAQQPSRNELRRAVLALARRRTREQITNPIKRLGRLLKRG